MKKNNLPVFPLGLVALPGTIQHLQIFEPRYVNMVKECMEKDQGFVIVFQKQALKNDDYEISKKGSYVEIIDFNNLPNGLLGITVKSINKVSIKDLTQEFYKKEKIKKGFNDISIYETWKKITDKKTHERTKKLFTKENKLFIKISSAPLRNELSNNKVILLSKIKEEHNFIDELYFI